MKRQFNKKRNPQGLKVGDNVWLEAKSIHSNRPEKIQTFQNHRKYWTRSISTGAIRKMDNT